MEVLALESGGPLRLVRQIITKRTAPSLNSPIVLNWLARRHFEPPPTLQCDHNEPGVERSVVILAERAR